MMQLKCPNCFACFSIEAALEDDAAREMMATLAKLDAALSRPLANYLALFRSRKAALAWHRALRLTTEALALSGDTDALSQALSEVVSAMREKQAGQGWVPLKNHNYLRRCLESVQAQTGQGVAPAATRAAPTTARSKAGAGLVALEGMKR